MVMAMKNADREEYTTFLKHLGSHQELGFDEFANEEGSMGE